MGRSAGTGGYIGITRRLTTDIPSIAANTQFTLSANAAGLGLSGGEWDENAAVQCCPDGGIEVGLVVACCYATNNEVRAVIFNCTNSPIDPAERTFTFCITPYRSGI